MRFIDADEWWKDPRSVTAKGGDEAEKTLYDGFQGMLSVLRDFQTLRKIKLDLILTL